MVRRIDDDTHQEGERPVRRAEDERGDRQCPCRRDLPRHHVPRDRNDGERDGATARQKFRHVTLPLLKPALLLALLFRTVDSLRVFDLVYVMTQGGPADATNMVQFYGYKKTFAEGMIGYGSAIAVTVFLLSLALGLAYLHAFRTRRWKEAGV